MSKISGVIVACLIALAILEGLVRWLRPIPPLPSTTVIGWNAEASPYKWSPHVDPNFLDNTPAEVNQLYLRGRPFPPRSPEKVRILLVGDSQVEAAALPHADLPERLLEQTLNNHWGRTSFEVRSIASSGWGQDQQLLALERYYASYDADYILLWFTPQNDFWENAFPDRSTSSHLGALKPTFVLGRDGLQPFEFPSNPNVAQQVFGGLHLYRLGFRGLERTGLREPSQILRDFASLIPGPEGHRTVEPQKCPPTVLAQDVYVRELATYSARSVSIETNEDVPGSRSNFAPFLAIMSERDKYLVGVTRSLIRRMIALAAEKGTKLIVFFNNQTWRGASNNSLRVGGCVRHSDRWYRTVNMVPRIKEALADIGLVELKTKQRDISLDQATVARDDRHLNALGNRLLFEELARVLAVEGLIERGPAGQASGPFGRRYPASPVKTVGTSRRPGQPPLAMAGPPRLRVAASR